MSRNKGSIGDVQADCTKFDPASWPEIRLRFCLTLNPSKQEIRDIPKDTELSFIPMEAVGEDGSLDVSTTRPIEDVESGYTFFRDDDVAIAKITPCFENGKGCIFKNLVNGYGFGTTELTVMRPEGLVPAYLYYLTISHHFRSMGIGLMQGSAGQKRVPDNFIRDYIIELPSESEQQAIVSYLDRETGRIDDLIRKKEQMIGLLKEKRIALITQTVTKGLDPNVKMKDSGIEWFGEVPEHWQINKVGRICRLQGGYAFDSELYGDEGAYLIQMSNLKSGSIELDENRKVPIESIPQGFILEPNDLLYGMSGSIGNYATVPETDSILALNQRVGRFITSPEIEPRYLFYFIQSDAFDVQVRLMMTGTAQFNISSNQIHRIDIAIADVTEQQAIAFYLDQETGRIDALIQKNEQMIELLKEYRSSLIHHAVTGKIDLRGYDD